MTLAPWEDFAETLPDATLAVDEQGVVAAANRRAAELAGYPRGELVGMPIEVLVPAGRREAHERHRERYRARPRTRPMGTNLDLALLRKDRETLPVDISLAPLELEGQRYVVATIRDQRVQRRTDLAFRAIAKGTAASTGEGFFHSLVRHLAAALDARYALVGRLTGTDARTVETLAVWSGDDFGEDFAYDLVGSPCETVVDRGVCSYPSGVRTAFPEDGGLVAMGVESYIGAPVFDSRGAPLGLVAVMDDEPMEEPVTAGVILEIFAARAGAELERLEAEKAVQEANERFQRGAVAVAAALYDRDVERNRAEWSEGITKVFGYPLEEVEPTYDWWLDRVHPDDRRGADAAFWGAVRTGEPYEAEYRFRTRSGSYLDVLDRALPVAAGHGRPARLVGGMVDITERKQLEGRLRQSQKLEAVGRLAGGIAHDFNNLLTAIEGYSDLMLAELGEADRLRTDVEEIAKAARRASSLTTQLLAFSRRQMLQPKVVEPNVAVRDLEVMLRRLLGEDVELICALDPELGRVLADPGQLAQVIVNLALNARDAMPDGGRITIETRNRELDRAQARGHEGVEPGSYVLLTVTDTGHGMDEETRAHVFEPFFTTKDGKGTGLGLATVYGIVKQSGGHVSVAAGPERGSVFDVYLPRVDDLPEPRPRPRSAAETSGGSETVLVVEDDDTVRELVCRVLEQHGYVVVEACDGEAALALLERSETRPDLLLTDTVMPSMSGPELAAKAAGLDRWDARVLFMSGYAPEALQRLGGFGPDALVQKPFSPADLLAAVREALDRPAST